MFACRMTSGEEGFYPHLEKAAVEKLQTLSPNNPILRVETPVVPTSTLGPQERARVQNEMQRWTQEMSSRENELRSSESVRIDETPVRNSFVSRTLTEKNMMNNASSGKPKEKVPRKCVPNDYNFWDKFDADGEVLKMDLEEERLSEKKWVEKKQQEESKKLKGKETLEDKSSIKERLNEIMVLGTGAGDGLSLPEKELISQQERQKGNECFRNQELTKALEHYTRSMAYLMTVEAVNNRAQTFLKLADYPGALEDCNKVLAIDPGNVKAYYRRGVAFFSCEKFQNALEDFEKALELNPDDKNIQDFLQKTRGKIGVPVSSKRVRMAIQTKSQSSSVVEEVSSSDTNDKYYPFFNTSPNEDIALNAIGTAKVMCRCNGTPGFIKRVQSLEDIKDHGRICLRRNTRPQNKDKDKAHANQKTVDTMDSIQQKSKIGESANNNRNVQKETEKFNGHNSEGKTSNASSNALANLEKLKSPFSFSVFWSSIKNINDLPSVAKALRALSPDQIAKVVDNKLEEKMLTLFILALRAHFSLPDEWGVVQRYLHSFTQLPRFSFVNMMLDKTTKKELELLLNDAEQLGLRVLDLLQLYGLTTCA